MQEKEIEIEDLTDQQIRDIEYDFKDSDLNDGDRHDGYLWRNILGKPYSTHPSKLSRQTDHSYKVRTGY